ncbi:Early nodulin-like protein [Thalictrum thalictroides]|uniref:Early nodulin-like protein n=1 Tax=Thalictrum thalictroides TaxID=46969 RepID=A0A7J6VSI5_THATH|nr:Early nodulin-like protein [Thalictrum thalictroides]
MASSQVTSPKLSILFFFISTLFMVSTFAAAHQFQLGWSKPFGNDDTESYDDWAERNRFHVGDTIYFKYENDSVLVVDRDDFRHCNVTNPISQLNDGNSVFRFDRYGFFYFISGEPGHCKSGQRVIIRVMVHPEIVEAPNIAPTPQGSRGGGEEGGGDWGGHAVTPNSTVRLPVASYFMTALGGVMVILYLFM